jgi:hypothetical protein
VSTKLHRALVARNLAFTLSVTGLFLFASAALAQDTHPSQGGSSSGSSQQQDQPPAKSEKKQPPPEPSTTVIHITVTDPKGKPVANASVYVRYNEPGGLFHHDKLSELNYKTNEEGTLKVKDVPVGKVLIQVIAPGWHTYGKWYDMDKADETVAIKLEEPTHWY